MTSFKTVPDVLAESTFASAAGAPKLHGLCSHATTHEVLAILCTAIVPGNMPVATGRSAQQALLVKFALSTAESLHSTSTTCAT